MFCYSHGEYLNEDGETADLNNTLAEYDFAFETYADSSSRVQITNRRGKDEHTNDNDYLGRIALYNAAALHMNETTTMYNVTGETEGDTPSTVDLHVTANYEADSDRLVVDFDWRTLSLLNFAAINFKPFIPTPPPLV
jgi:hypothetical protein